MVAPPLNAFLTSPPSFSLSLAVDIFDALCALEGSGSVSKRVNSPEGERKEGRKEVVAAKLAPIKESFVLFAGRFARVRSVGWKKHFIASTSPEKHFIACLRFKNRPDT